jgi:DNA-binding PadR family transcriptional regulator
MSDEPTAGEARTGTDAPPTEKPDAAVLGRGETHIPDEDAVLLTDGGEPLPGSLIDALEASDCHPDVILYVEKAADLGSTPILGSLRYFHRETSVSRIAEIGTQIEQTLWNHGAGAVLAHHGHVDETSTVILEEIDRDETDEQELVADGGTVAANGGTSNRFPELADIHRDILLTLARSGPTHGRGLMDDLATLRDEDITDSRLYRNLGDLDGLGLVEIREHVHDDRSHEYALTAQGRSAVREHAQRVTGAVEALQEADR